MHFSYAYTIKYGWKEKRNIAKQIYTSEMLYDIFATETDKYRHICI